MKTCNQPNCERKHSAKGVCAPHYYKLYRGPEVMKPIQLRAKTRNKEYLRQLKDKPCYDCDQSYPYYVMQFDHVRGEKRFDMANYGSSSLKTMLEESEKCDVVCANCHAERTHQRRISES